jgi:hypothetical protein
LSVLYGYTGILVTAHMQLMLSRSIALVDGMIENRTMQYFTDPMDCLIKALMD